MESFEKLTNISVDKEGDDLYIYAKDQCWSDEVTQKELLSLNIILNNALPVMIIPRKNSNPLLQIGSEDDGIIRFNDNKNSRFDAYWAKSLIDNLNLALDIIEKRGQMKFKG